MGIIFSHILLLNQSSIRSIMGPIIGIFKLFGERYYIRKKKSKSKNRKIFLEN